MKKNILTFTILIFMGIFSNLFGQKKIEQNWQFYITNIDDKPASIALNLALKEILPIKNFSDLCWVSVKLNNPTDNGLTNNEESDILGNIEDELIKILPEKSNIFMGRITNNGTRDFFFYTENKVEFENNAKKITLKFLRYTFDFGNKVDKNWQGYLDIYPSEMDMQSISNRDVLEQLEKNGDKLEKPREVFHWIYFKNEKDRENYLNLVTKDNFQLVNKEYNKKDEYKFFLQIKRVDKVGYEYIDDYTLYLWRIAKENNGEYDGWETSVEKE